jgi:hypothetical protein
MKQSVSLSFNTLEETAKKLLLRFVYDIEFSYMARKFLIDFMRKVGNKEVQSLIPKEEEVLSYTSLHGVTSESTSEPTEKEAPEDSEMEKYKFNIFCLQYERAYIPVDEFCFNLIRFTEETHDFFKKVSKLSFI